MYKIIDLQKNPNEFESEISERLKLAIQVAIKHPIEKFLIAKTESYITPFGVIVATNSPKQIDAITMEILKKLKEEKLFNLAVKVDGNSERGWCIIDLGDCFFNLITIEKLSFYKLEDVLSGKANADL